MIARTAATLLLAALLSACASDPTEGWSARSTFSEEVATVAVPIFRNETYHRDLEFELTDAVIKEILARTPWRIASSVRADTVLLGRIRAVEIDPLSDSRLTGLSEEVLLSVTIDFEWKDLRSDAPLLERTDFSGHGLFVPSNPTGEPIQVGEFNVVQGLARDVVSEMRSNW